MNKVDKVWELHKSIYRHLKKKAQSLEGEVSKELIQYEKNQRKYASRDFVQSSMDELFERINSGHVVYLGDFHSFDQNSRNLERLIRNLIKQKEAFSLGVEFVDQKHQRAIDHYLARNITELEFLEEIQYHESWRFPWVYYRPFFQMARENNVAVLALNSEGGLKERDLKAAQKIEHFFEKSPDSRLLVLFGELHIVPNKLPQMVKSKLSALIKDYQDVIIHQNLDEVYWKLNEINIERHNQIISFDKNEYAILSAPPWIKYESMIYWYENLADSPELEINDYLLSEGVLYLNSNVPENFLFLCEKIRETLELEDKIDPEDLEDFNLYEHQKLEVVTEKISHLPKKLATFFERLVAEGRVFRIPLTSSYYCSSYSINRMGQLAGVHLEHLVHQKLGLKDERIWINSKNFEKFIAIIKTNALGFLSSKIINPYRKCDLYGDFQIQLKSLEQASDKDSQKLDVLRLTLACVELEKDAALKEIVKPGKLMVIHEAARKIGFYWGEIIYEEFLMKKRNMHFNHVMAYLFSSSLEENEFKEVLRQILPAELYPKHKKRYF